MKRLAVLLAFLALAACGADGPPERPGAAPGIAVTGRVEVGVTGGS